MQQLKFRNLPKILILLLAFNIGAAVADADPMGPMYEMDLPKPKTDLAAGALTGKIVRYGYHSFWEVNKDKGSRGAPAPMMHDVIFYENGECEWFSLDIFAGEHVRAPCGSVQVAPNIYQVSWLEAESKQVVTLILNLNTWQVNTSFHFNTGEGLALWEGKIYFLGDYPIPPVTEKN